MEFEVYCDESRPDLLGSNKPQGQFMVLGSLWLHKEDRNTLKTAIHNLRDQHKIGGEFKWQKASPSRSDFYKQLVEFFHNEGDRLRFRCIAVDQSQVDLQLYHDDDQELGFYKFYYQMLHHWILDFNDYSIFCDFKSNRARDRLQVLQRCLAHANLSSTVSTVQAVRSDESVLIQVADVLTGIASARLNQALVSGSAKEEVVGHLESCLGRRISHTPCSESKFNVFQIRLGGGW